MRYEVQFRGEEPQIFDDENSAACAIIENEDYIDDRDVDIDEYLDDSYGRIEIAGHTFYASRILYEMAEDTYYEIRDEEKRNEAENDCDWIADQLYRMSEGEVERFDGGIRVTCIGDDEDEDDEGDDEIMSILDIVV